jgi:UDP-N-acetylmuramoyl-L-alanyl-D-glutamate--2,6-diaminopimelate ligase
MDIEVTDVCFDSRKVQPGSLFIAVRGTAIDGHQFISDVESKGVAAIMNGT